MIEQFQPAVEVDGPAGGIHALVLATIRQRAIGYGQVRVDPGLKAEIADLFGRFGPANTSRYFAAGRGSCIGRRGWRSPGKTPGQGCAAPRVRCFARSGPPRPRCGRCGPAQFRAYCTRGLALRPPLWHAPPPPVSPRRPSNRQALVRPSRLPPDCRLCERPGVLSPEKAVRARWRTRLGARRAPGPGRSRLLLAPGRRLPSAAPRSFDRGGPLPMRCRQRPSHDRAHGNVQVPPASHSNESLDIGKAFPDDHDIGFAVCAVHQGVEGPPIVPDRVFVGVNVARPITGSQQIARAFALVGAQAPMMSERLQIAESLRPHVDRCLERPAGAFVQIGTAG